MAALDLEELVRNNERNRRGGGYLEFNERRASLSAETNRQKSDENV